jgi:hypothetical protein
MIILFFRTFQWGKKEEQIRLLNRLKRKAAEKNQVKHSYRQAAAVAVVVAAVASKQ